MTIVTFTRSTPDTAAKVVVDAGGAVTWGDAAPVVNPWDEYSLEEAILQANASGGKAIAVAIGSELHNEALKHSLAMGINEAIRVEEPGADVTDSLTWATLAAGTVNKIGDVDLVLFGKESIDVASDLHTYQLARKLGWTMLSYVAQILDVDYAAKTIKVEKVLEQGKQVVTTSLPAVVSVMKDINEPRYPSFIGIRKASKATIPVWGAADLGVSFGEAKTAVSEYRNLPTREINTEIIAGESAQEQAATLVQRLLEEKVL